MRKLFLIIALVVMVGCATMPTDLSMFTPREQGLIRNGEIGRGMSEEALIASWGGPNEYRVDREYQLYRIKQYVSGSGRVKTYIYQYSGYYYNSYRFVYVERGEVTGWSF